MKRVHKPTCYLIGQGNLLLECAKILRSRSFVIKGIISPSSDIKKWSQSQQIDWFQSVSEIDWEKSSPDYLFSIVNYKIIPANVLQHIRRLVINYHDAPLPRYGGTNATSWALLNKETTHGITWHIVNELIDGGDVLKQVVIPVLPDETAISLDMKCIEKAIASFPDLVDELLNNSYQRTPQDLSQRTYFSRFQKPIGNGWVDWYSSSEEIERLWRATQFGDYRNRFAITKIILNKDVFSINSLTVLSEPSNLPPGNVVEMKHHYWKIATTTYNLLLSNLSTAQGQLVELDVLANQYDITVGMQLPSPTQLDREQFLTLSQQCANHEAYWVEKLKSFEFTTITSQEVDVNLQMLPTSLYSRFLDFAQDTANLPIVVLAAWLSYLHRLENQAQVGIYLRLPQFFIPTNLLPFFATYLPFSVTIKNDCSFEHLVKQIQQEYHQLSQHKTYLHDCWQRYPELAGIAPTHQSGYQLNLDSVTACSDEGVFALPKPFLILCDELLRHPRQSILKVDWITQQERQLLTIAWNNTKRPYPAKTIHQLFEEQVEKTPNNTALVYEDVKLTYSELNQYANHLAHHLQKNLSIKPDDLVILCMERSHLTLVALLAILKSGGAYVPVDPGYPDERMQYVINDTKSTVILTDRLHQDRLTALLDHKTHTVVVIDDNELSHCINTSLKENPISSTANSHLAYVIYTSGTTGQPNGVMVEHQSVINLVFMQANEFELSTASVKADKADNKECYRRCLGFANLVFDAHVWEYYVTLLNGHSLYLINNALQRDIEQLSRYIKSNNIYIATIPPILLDCSHLLPLKKLIVAGEKTRESVLATYFKNGVEIINAYGPTEATVCATMHHYQLNDIASNIGKPITNAQIYILDSQQKSVPISVVGEIYIGGAGIARGYLNRPALTAEKFVINSFQTEEEKHQDKNEKIYKSGDLGRWLPDGTIEYIGRNDGQIKISGCRVELSEIENVLASYPDSIIDHVAVLSQGEAEKYLVAYYTSSNEIELNKLEQYLSARLLSYMLPKAYVHLNAFPYTINGKLDQAALPNPEFKNVQENSVIANQLEAIVCKAYAQVLDISESEIGIDHDFFKIGGNSLSAIRLTAKLRPYLEVRVQDIFELKTPNKIAHSLPVSAQNIFDKIDDIGKIYTNTIPFAAKDWIESSNPSLLQKQHQYLQRANQIKFSQTTKKIQRVLLTGATGHLGCHVLEKLLRETAYTIYLPIRASSEKIAYSRLWDKFNYYFDSSLLAYKNRIVVFDAEIEKPNLGLTTEKYNILVSEIDSVIHCAALVKHQGHYDEFYQANIQATRNLLEFTRLTCYRDFHHVSTVSVPLWGYIPGESDYLFTEEDDVSKVVHGNNFYPQTKYHAELLIYQYRERGVQGSIYRVGNLGMNSVNYRVQENIEDNFFFSHFKSMIRLQMVPHEFSKVEWSPVDHTALAIVKLFDKVELSNQVHHLFNPHTCDLFTLLNNVPGLDLKKVHINEFVKEVLIRVNNDDTTKAPHLLNLYQLWVNEIHGTYITKIRLSQEKTEHILAAYGFHWSKITINMLSDFLKKSIDL